MRITVAPGAAGSVVHTNTVIKTGESLSYVLVPKAQLSPGDRIEAMRVFGRSAGGKDTRPEKRTEPQVVLTPPIIADFPNGSFVRIREAP